MLTEELNVIEARYEATSDAPLEVYYRRGVNYKKESTSDEKEFISDRKIIKMEVGQYADVHFFVCARADIPALCAEVRKLQAENAELKEDACGKRGMFTG